jgi:hypothetical protein
MEEEDRRKGGLERKGDRKQTKKKKRKEKEKRVRP